MKKFHGQIVVDDSFIGSSLTPVTPDYTPDKTDRITVLMAFAWGVAVGMAIGAIMALWASA